MYLLTDVYLTSGYCWCTHYESFHGKYKVHKEKCPETSYLVYHLKFKLQKKTFHLEKFHFKKNYFVSFEKM